MASPRLEDKDLGSFTLLKKKLNEGADPNKVIYSTTSTPYLLFTAIIKRAIEYKYFYDPSGDKKPFIDIIELLIMHGASLNASDSNRHMPTAIHAAADFGSDPTIRLLLQHKANVNEPSREGTPLERAVQRGHVDCVKTLLENKANANESISIYEQCAPLEQAVRRGHIDCVKILLEHKADANKLNIQGQWLKSTPLIQAVLTGRADCVKLLLEHQADINAGFEEPGMLVAEAARRRDLDCFNALLNFKASPIVKASSLFASKKVREMAHMTEDHKQDKAEKSQKPSCGPRRCLIM